MSPVANDPDSNNANSADVTPRPRIWSVSELNRRVRGLLEANLELLWVAGELSNVTRAASGHWYFTLKDDAAQARCVMFRNRAALVGFVPEAGMKVEVQATPTLYEARGDFQLGVEAMRRAGLGALFEAYERLKARLADEGLFDAAAKRAVPAFPRAIGIVTSLQAAALRDVLTTLSRRAPMVRLIVYPTAVQGKGAAAEIAAAIDLAARRNEVDTLIICRGGGSIEDLWSFNEEAVARAIARLRASCGIAVISGVGHETDFTIADFVADVRAATPTAAAELAAPLQAELLARLALVRVKLARAQRSHLRQLAQRIDLVGHRLLSPAARVRRERERLAALARRAAGARQRLIERARARWAETARALRASAP
ncbi:MAG TPA: exodeoxyribonuclease VII large subunit, partial [Usitatibacteraceae bacterium]|nr:exodeoxyribonuclease VII large subunit [Usitatibacteraceae bacterium]